MFAQVSVRHRLLRSQAARLWFLSIRERAALRAYLLLRVQMIKDKPGNVGQYPCQTFQPGSITSRPDDTVLLTWLANKSVYAGVFASSWQPLWSGEISSKVEGEAINVAPYVRKDDRLDGEANADMDISLQFGFQKYAEVDSALMEDGAFLVVWRLDDGQLYSRLVRVRSLPTPNV